MAYQIADLLADCKTTCETLLIANGGIVKLIAYPPPLTWPAYGPFVQIEYGGAEIEQASDEVTLHTIQFWALMPLRGNLAATEGEYANVIKVAQQIHRAFYANVIIGDEAAIASPGTIAKPDYVQLGEQRCVRCIYTLQCVTSEDVANLVTD